MKKVTLKINDLVSNFAGLSTPNREINPAGDVDILVEERVLEEFKIFIHYYERMNNFSSLLFQLIMKADRNNLAKLSRGFPNEVFLVVAYGNIDGFAQEYVNV